MQNGYVLPTSTTSIKQCSQRLLCDAKLVRDVEQALRIGVHWKTQVGLSDTQKVTQVFCSAFPISYSDLSQDDWEPFARTILRSTYQSTLAVGAFLSMSYSRRVKVYLTKVGGGAFGNPDKWIADAISTAIKKYEMYPLDVYLVHYRCSAPDVYLHI